MLATLTRRAPFSFGRGLLYLFLSVFALLFLMPFYYGLVASFMPISDLYHLPLNLLPPKPTLDNITTLLTGRYPTELSSISTGILRPIFNSFSVAIAYTVGSLFFCSLAGYAFAKYRFRGRDPLFGLLLATMMVPNAVGLIPNFIIMSRLHWVDTWLPLIIPGMANAFGIFWMRQYMFSVPDELIDAARIDGSGEFGTYWRIVMPIVRPALAALGIYMFLGSWNSFMAPLIYLKNEVIYTVPLFLALLNGQEHYKPVTLVITASMISVVPVLAIFLAMQRQFISGITLGALKE
jgi:ABC-type glycerol-3-phosphate transport system permease component